MCDTIIAYSLIQHLLCLFKSFTILQACGYYYDPWFTYEVPEAQVDGFKVKLVSTRFMQSDSKSCTLTFTMNFAIPNMVQGHLETGPRHLGENFLTKIRRRLSSDVYSITGLHRMLCTVNKEISVHPENLLKLEGGEYRQVG